MWVQPPRLATRPAATPLPYAGDLLSFLFCCVHCLRWLVSDHKSWECDMHNPIVEETSPGLMQAGIAPRSHAEHGASAHSAAVPQPEQQQRQPTRTATLSRRHRRRRTCHTIACHHLTFGGEAVLQHAMAASITGT
jgi:hypothetical protein